MEKFIPNAPLFQDPIYDGAADPVVIWNHNEQAWWMFYTNRRASEINHGVSYMHGTKIGIASSKDFGKTWIYRGSLDNLEFEPGTNTFWAPEIIFAQGQYHMYISYVRGIPNDWNCERHILHYTSNNLWDWNFRGIIPLSSDRVIDACVFEVTPGKYKMWYKDEVNNSYTYSAESNDLERLTKPKSNQSSSKGEKGQMDISPTFISNKQTPISMEPGKGALDNPTVFSKMSGTLCPSSGNSVLYVPYRARLSAKWVIISFISVEFLRVTSRFPMQIPQGWQMIKHIF